MEDLVLKFQEFFSALSQGIRLFSPLKRLVVVICLIAIIPVYFISRGASSAYWNHKFKPTLLTAHASFSNPSAITATQVTILPQGSGAYSAYVQITNNNLELAANNFSYTFSFYNAAHELQNTTQGKSYIIPAQRKYLVVARFTAHDIVTSGTFAINNEVQWQKRFSIPTVALEAPTPVKKTEISTGGDTTFSLGGTVYNNSPYKLGSVTLVYFLYDADNHIVAASQRTEFTLNPHERRAYKQVWPGVLGTEIGKVTVSAETNELQSDNIQSVE